jgi:hypothetical protein
MTATKPCHANAQCRHALYNIHQLGELIFHEEQ